MSLRIIPIVCPGESIIGMGRLQELGYEVTPHIAELLDFSCLTDDFPEDKLTRWLGYNPEAINDRYRRSLRTSWVQMIKSNMSVPDSTIFAESDAWPCDEATADRMEKLLEEELLPRAKRERYDVIRLFNHCYDTYPDEEVHLDEVKWEKWITPIGKISYDIKSLGTHSLVIPLESRRKVAKVFSSIKLPTDAALEYAAQMGMLNVLTADANVFMQKTRTKDDAPGKAYSGMLRKFLVCMTSYKRPFDLMRQIYAFMDQTYSEFHMSVIIRGISEYDVGKFILPSLKHFMEEGRLSLMLRPNFSCFANTVECMLNHDLDKYDYVCKVDDDDWYSRDYLFTINNFLNYIGDMAHGVYNSRQDYEIKMQKGIPVFDKVFQPIYENTLVFPSSIAKKLVQVYHSEKGGVGKAPLDYCPHTDKNGVIWGDGAYIRKLMEEQGCNDIGAFALERVPFLSVVNKSNKSFLREGFYTPQLQLQAARDSGDFRQVPPEFIAKFGEEVFQIIGNMVEQVSKGRHGTVKGNTSKKLTITWDDGIIEDWELQKDGRYKLCNSD